MDMDREAVARVRAAEVELNDAIRALPSGISVVVDTVKLSMICDAPEREYVALRVSREY